MRHFKILSTTLLTIGVASGVSLAVRSVKARNVWAAAGQSAATSEGRHVPFTALMVDTLYRYPTADVGLEGKTLFAIRSDGSTAKRREDTAPSGVHYEVTGVNDVQGRRGFT
jgi:hypothetical protein